MWLTSISTPLELELESLDVPELTGVEGSSRLVWDDPLDFRPVVAKG